MGRFGGTEYTEAAFSLVGCDPRRWPVGRPFEYGLGQ